MIICNNKKIKTFLNNKRVYVPELIKVNESVDVTSINITPNSAILDIGDTLQLSAQIVPDNATNKSIIWSSGDSRILSVTNTGLVTCLEEGATSVYCTSISNPGVIGHAEIVVNGENVEPPAIIDEYEIPWINTYYFNPKPYNDEEAIVPIYISDFYRVEYNDDDYSLKFRLKIEVDGNVSYLENLQAGDHNINLGILEEGMHWFSLQVIDEQNRTSQELFNELMVVDRATYAITPAQIYTITDSDLATYGANRVNSQVLEDMNNNRTGLTQLFADLRDAGYRKCIMPFGTYRVNRAKRAGNGVEAPIDIPSNFTVDLNGSTIKMHPYSDSEYGTVGGVDNLIVRMRGCIDSHLINGIIEGDYAERTTNGWLSGSNGEGSNGFAWYGGGWNSVDNVTVTQVTGYSMVTYYNNVAGSSQTVGLSGWVDNLCIENGIETEMNFRTTSTYSDITKITNIDTFICASVWLAFGYLKGQYWDCEIHFYDTNKNFIETRKVFQYRYCKIPNGAKFARVTIKGTSTDVDGICLHNRPSPKYCALKNIDAPNNRTCFAPFQCNNLLYDNIVFDNPVQSITPCAIDLEDGWEATQDFYLMNCELKSGSGLISNCGQNIVIEGCKNFSLTLRYRIGGLIVRNNVLTSLRHTIGWMCGQNLSYYNNTINGTVSMDTTGIDTKRVVKIKNNIITGAFSNEMPDFLYEKNTINQTTGLAALKIKDSEITSKTTSGYLGDKIFIENCNYRKGDEFTSIKLSFNAMDAYREWRNCNFYDYTDMVNHNSWNSALFENCTFHENCKIYPQAVSKVMGQLQFNNCTFKKDVVFGAGTQSFIQVNDCTIDGAISYLGSGQANTEFNDTVPTISNYIKIAVPLEYIAINAPEKLTYLILPYSSIDKSITWSSSDSSIAYVDTDDMLRGLSEGQVTLTASTNDGGSSDSITVRMVDVDYRYGYINSTGGIQSFTNNYMNNRYEAASGTITIATSSAFTSSGITTIKIAEYDSEKGFIQANQSRAGTSGTFTLHANTRFIRVMFIRNNQEKRLAELFATYTIT